MSVRILVTAAGSGPSNNLMRSVLHGIPEATLIGCHSDRFILKKSPAQRNFLLPPLDTREGRVGLEQVVAAAQASLVIPGNDRDACALASLRQRRRLSARMYLPALKTIELCQDKGALSVFLRDHGVAAPRTCALSDRQSLARAWAALDRPDLAWCRIRRGFASRGATMVRDVEQAWAWISYWNAMRGVPVTDFTLSEYLPGRDFNVQGIWSNGKLALIKMCERLSYLNAEHHPSGMASTPALAKTVWEPAAIATCEAALKAIDETARGVYSIDLKENDAGVACITEINAGRFCMITNIHDFTGRYNMATTYVRLALGRDPGIENPYDCCADYYLVRDLDTLPTVLSADALFEGIERPQAVQIRA
jgi:hypothetical protein